jgi:hypothetical protein
MFEPGVSTLSRRRAVQIAAALSLVYFAIQLIYIWRLPLVMDEFDGANEVYSLLSFTPYKDFRPYKTVLGYYLQIPPLLLTTDPWTGLMLSKVWLALINTAAIFTATLCLATLFTPGAALVGQTLLISVTTFLERSSELRVDMLTAWVGLASFLLLLNRRWLLAGVVAGLSFLVSQKGVYYALSANAAAGVFWLFESRDRRTFRDLVLLNAGAGATIAVYIALWAIVSTPWAVFSATFLNHGAIAFGQLYDLEFHWHRTLTRNPFFYGGALAGIVALAAARWRGSVGSTHVMTAVYGASMFALCRWHKQPWPYFFVILMPTLMVVHAAVGELALRHRRWAALTLSLALWAGVIGPFTYMPDILARDNTYQRHVVRLARAMLDEGETYVAGNDLVYDREQAHPALRRLSAPNIRAMQEWPKTRLDTVIAELEAAKPRLIIADYRVGGLPIALGEYLATRFDPLWSSVSGYAPLIDVSDDSFDIWFDGEYRVESDAVAVIDDTHAASGTMVTLRHGRHRNDSTAPVRLRLIPAELAKHADPAMEEKRSMFAGVYDY